MTRESCSTSRPAMKQRTHQLHSFLIRARVVEHLNERIAWPAVVLVLFVEFTATCAFCYKKTKEKLETGNVS